MSTEAEQQANTLHFLDYWRVIRSRKEIVLAVAILVVLTGTVYTLMLPNIFAASARIRVSEDAPSISPFAPQGSAAAVYNPYFLKTQFEVLTSKPLLYEVINRLNLQQEWGSDGETLPRDVALKIMQNSVDVFQQRDTSLIVINVKRDNPEEAADIANILAEVYRDSRLDLASKEARGAIDQIQIAVKEQAQRVVEAEQKVQEIREQFGLAVIGGEGSVDVSEMQMQQLESDRMAAQQAMMEKEGILGILENLEDADLVDSASGITSDPMVMNAVQQIQEIDVQLSALTADYGPNHPEILRFQYRKKKAEEVLKQQLQSLRNRVQQEYELAQIRFNKVDSVLESVKTRTIEEQGKEYQPFRKALADLDIERMIYNQLSAKLRQEIITVDVPRNPVEIIDTAEPNRRPVSPNLFMNVLLSIFVGLGGRRGAGLLY